MESALMRALTRVWKRPVAWVHENADELATTDAVKDDAEGGERCSEHSYEGGCSNTSRGHI